MNQFNPINLLNAFINATLAIQQTAVKPGDVNSNTQTSTTTNSSLLNSNNQPKTAQHQAQNIEQIMQENSAAIKEALQLPQDLKDLISQLESFSNTQSAGQNNKAQNTLNGKNIDLNMLSNILGENSKETMGKLIQVISKESNINVKTVKTALSGAIDIGGVSENSNNQVIKNVLLLYLPYLPFDPEKKNFNFEVNFAQKEEDDISDQEIELLIRTENYGNIKAILTMGNEKTVNIIINCHKAFPSDLLNKLIQKEANKNKLKVVTNFSDKNQPSKSLLGAPKKDDGQAKEVKIKSSSSKVNSNLILMSYALIKSVFEIDKG